MKLHKGQNKGLYIMCALLLLWPSSVKMVWAEASQATSTNYILRVGSWTGGGNRSTDGRLEGSAGQTISGYSGSRLSGGTQHLTNKPADLSNLQPTAGSQTDDKTPELSWTYSDGENNVQSKYQVQVSSDNFATFTANSGIVSSSANSFTPSSLPDEDYLWRVRTFDGFDWSGFQALSTTFSIGAGSSGGPVVTPAPPPNPVDGTGTEEDPTEFNEPDPQFVVVPSEVVDDLGEGDLFKAFEDSDIDSVMYELRNQDGVLLRRGEMRSRRGLRLADLTVGFEEQEDGYYVLRVMTIYKSGKEGIETLYHFSVDTIPPTITVLNPSDDSILGLGDEKPDIQVGIYDATAGVDPTSIQMSIDTSKTLAVDVEPIYEEQPRAPRTGSSGVATYNAYLSPFTEEGLAEGIVSVNVRVTDVMGNEGVQVWQFLVDRHAPTGTILINDGDDKTYRTFVTLRIESVWGEGEAPIADVKILNDGTDFDLVSWQPFIPDEGPYVMHQKWTLKEEAGTRVVSIRLRDGAGNESVDTIIEDSIELSIQYPETFITGGPSGIVEETEAVFTYYSSKRGSAFKMKLDDEPWSDWSSEQTIAFDNLSEGNHYFQVKSGKDANLDLTISLDEEDPIPATRSWTIGPIVSPEEDKKPVHFWRHE